MKRQPILIAVILVMGLSALLCGCANAAPAMAANGGASGFSAEDMFFPLDGKTYTVLTDAAPLLEALGDDFELYEAISCLFDGMDKSFDYGDVYITTYPIDGKDVIDEIILLGGAYPTAKGVKVGGSKADIEAAYGTGYELDGDILTYCVTSASDSQRLYFQLDEDDDTILLISYSGGTGL